MASASILLITLTAACHRRESIEEPLNIFAAASTSEPVSMLAKTFERQTGGRTRLAFGASSDLARQIKAGAPADVFLSADQHQMHALEVAGLIDRQTVRELLSNRLVVMVPLTASGDFRGPQDLMKVRRLALADPEAVPAGVYAKRWLESVGLWSSLRSRVVPSLDVRAALSAVDTGAIDAAIVYKTDAAVSKASRIAFEVPPKQGPEIVYPIAKVTHSKHPGVAQFLQLIESASAGEVFTSHGFIFLPTNQAPPQSQ